MQKNPHPEWRPPPGTLQNTKLKKLLNILSDGLPHSGAALGKKLGITRSAVWKLIHQLQQELGVTIDAKTNQGYCLQDNIELLDLHKISGYLDPRYHSYLDNCAIFDEIPSTSDYLLAQARRQQWQTRLCLAEVQTASRGRFNRSWLAPFGHNICFSLLWQLTDNLTDLSGLSLIIAVAVIRMLKRYGVRDAINIKWPNDLYWQGRKLGGVLIDLQGEMHHHYAAVIGIGLNLAIDNAVKKKCRFPIVDLAEIIQTIPPRNQLIGLLLEEIFDALAIFQTQGLKPFLREFKQLDCIVGKPIDVTVGKETHSGIARGIDANGCLLLEDTHGNVHRFTGGETSLHR